MSKVAHTTHSVIGKVIHRGNYICSVCGEPMFTIRGYSGLRCPNGHKIGDLHHDGTFVCAKSPRNEDKP